MFKSRKRLPSRLATLVFSLVLVTSSLVPAGVVLAEDPTIPEDVYSSPIPSGGTVPISGTTSGTTTGWQKYDSTTDTSTVYVDPEKTQVLFVSAPAAGVVLVSAPAGAQDGAVPANVSANLPLDVVSQGSGSTVPSVLKMGSIDMALPPAVMQSLGESVRNAGGALASLRIEVKTSTDDGTKEILNNLQGVDLAGMKPASQVITVSFLAVDVQGKETKITVDKTKVAVDFNPDAVKDPSKVNLYIIGSLIYVGGKVDSATHRITADISKIQGARLVALEYDKTFSDIATHWAKADIELMASKYVVKGMTETEFWPSSQVTRAQFVTLLARSIGLAEQNPAKGSFRDVAPGTWYYGYVEAAFKAGLATGDGGKGGNFRPNESITREEMSVLLSRALRVYGTPLATVAPGDSASLLGLFVDASSISDWAKAELSQAVNGGLMKGRPGGVFDPKGNGTRAEAATMMSRLMKTAGII